MLQIDDDNHPGCAHDQNAEHCFKRIFRWAHGGGADYRRARVRDAESGGGVSWHTGRGPSREELWKYERNSLDAWDELLAHTNENKAPNPESTYRFKFHGFFYVALAQDSFILRMRVPGAVLTSAQMRGMANIAEDWGCGRGDLATRANVQIREL